MSTQPILNDAATAEKQLRLVRLLGRRFREAKRDLFLVGGSVREPLLGRTSEDIDLATSARPEETVEILERFALGRPYRVGERYGTIGVHVEGHSIEITTYRSSEHYPPDSRKPQVQFGTTIHEDLGRRDFTVNAMARDALGGELIDPYGGRRDLLEEKVIRAVGVPADRFREDPLRLLRAVRFASRLGLEIEAGTREAIRNQAERLDAISPERIREEYEKILCGPLPSTGLGLLRNHNLLANSVPGLMELDRMADHGPAHPLSLWEHTMAVVEGVDAEKHLRWAALLHDIAKPKTRTHEPSGRPRFFHHEKLGAAMAREILTSLRYSNDVIDAVALLIETHMQLHAYSDEWSDGALRRLMLRLDDLMADAVQLARADANAHVAGGVSTSSVKFDRLQKRMAGLGMEEVNRLRSPLSGRDLMERFGREPGPWIKDVKEALLEEVLEGKLAPDDKAGAWRLATGLVERG